MLLALLLALCCALAGAEESGKMDIGTISVNGAFTLKSAIPEGYTLTPVYSGAEQIVAVLSSEDPDKPAMMLSVAFDETYADVDRMNDLSEEDLALLEKTYTDVDPDVEFFYTDTGLGTRLLVARHSDGDQDYVDFLSVYKGYFVEFVLTARRTAEDRNLTDDQIQMCVDYLTELDFVPAHLPVITSAEDLAGMTVLANLTDYDAASGTLQADIRQTIELDAETVKGLKVGDSLALGELNVDVETLVTEEDWIEVNNEIFLYPVDDHYIAMLYEMTYTESMARLTLAVPENLIFVDGIDPETGNVLEEKAERTAAEFINLLSGGSLPDFSSENVDITFGTDGQLVKVERFYTPWQ